MSDMFNGAVAFNQNIGAWGTKTSSVTNMSNMFKGASVFNQDITSWNTSSVSNMVGMFMNASAFDQDIESWTVLSVSDMTDMFNGATVFNSRINYWTIGTITLTNMLANSGLVGNEIGLTTPTPLNSEFNQVPPDPITNSNRDTIVAAWIADPTQAMFTNAATSPYYAVIKFWDVRQLTDASSNV